MQPRVCNYCWKTFSNSFNLKQHIVNVHVQSQGVACSLCDKVVKNKWYLRKHLVTAHGAPLKRVKTADGGIAVPASASDGKTPEERPPQHLPQQPLQPPLAAVPSQVVASNGQASAAHITVPQPLILNQNPSIAAALTKNFVLPLFSYDPATAALVGVMSGAQAAAQAAVIPGQAAAGGPQQALAAVQALPVTAPPSVVGLANNQKDVGGNDTVEDDEEELDVDN